MEEEPVVWSTGLEEDALRGGQALTPARCVTLGKLFKLSEPRFLHLFNGDKNMPQECSQH